MVVGSDARRQTHGERGAVAGAVAVPAMKSVEERRINWADQPVGDDTRVRRTPLTGDRVDASDRLRAEIVEGLRNEADGLVPISSSRLIIVAMSLAMSASGEEAPRRVEIPAGDC